MPTHDATDQLRRLRNRIAHMAHPDLGRSDEDRVRRNTIMSRVNQAFDDGDMTKLETILAELTGQKSTATEPKKEEPSPKVEPAQTRTARDEKPEAKKSWQEVTSQLAKVLSAFSSVSDRKAQITPELVARYVRRVRELINDGANLQANDSNGDFLLHYAVRHFNFPEVIELLIQSGAPVDMRNKAGQTALQIAIGNMDDALAAKLIMLGADTRIPDTDGFGVNGAYTRDAGASSKASKSNGARSDSDSGTANPNAKARGGGNKDGNTSRSRRTRAAAASERQHATERLFQILTPFSSAKDRKSRSTLGFIQSYLQSISKLIEEGAHVDARNDKGDTPLHVAVRHFNLVEVIDLLVNAGVHVDTQGAGGKTATHIATENQDDLLSTRLVQLGAEQDIPDANGVTVDDLLAERKAAKAKASRPTDRHSKRPRSHSTSPFDDDDNLDPDAAVDEAAAAAERGPSSQRVLDDLWEELTQYAILADRGRSANENQCNAIVAAIVRILNHENLVAEARYGNGDTILHAAIRHGAPAEVLKHMIARGARINATDNRGRTPLLLTLIDRQIESARMLIRLGANRTVVDRDGIDPAALLWALRHELRDVVSWNADSPTPVSPTTARHVNWYAKLLAAQPQPRPPRSPDVHVNPIPPGRVFVKPTSRGTPPDVIVARVLGGISYVTAFFLLFCGHKLQLDLLPTYPIITVVSFVIALTMNLYIKFRTER